MKRFIHNHSVYLLSCALFVSLCFNLRYALRIFLDWRTDHLRDYALYRPVGIGLHHGGVFILFVIGCLLVRGVYRREKQRSERLSKGAYIGIACIGLLTLGLPVIASGDILMVWKKTLEMLVWAIAYLTAVITYLWITDSHT